MGFDPIQVLFVDESSDLAERLQDAPPAKDRVQVLGTVDFPDIAAEIDGSSADVVVVNVDSPDVDTVADVIASSRARMLAVTESSAPVVAHRALGLGACGVVARGADIRTLIESLIRARAGELVLPSHMLGDIVSRLTIDGSPGSLSARISLLTVREREILIALADGDPALQIAQRLGISPQTVQSHVKNVLSKLGVHSKLEAVGLAWRAGLGSADLPTQAS